jgi:hypothetical protein
MPCSARRHSRGAAGRMRDTGSRPCAAGTKYVSGEKQRHAAHHDHDRDHASCCALQRYVAEARRRQRSDGEIQRVRVVVDVRIHVVLRLVNNRRHHEDEDEKVRTRKYDLFVALEERTVLAKSLEKLIRVQKPQGAQDAQKARSLSDQRSQKRDNGCQIGPGRGMQELSRA